MSLLLRFVSRVRRLRRAHHFLRSDGHRRLPALCFVVNIDPHMAQPQPWTFFAGFIPDPSRVVGKSTCV
jgi:hypothetical protein